MVVTAVLPLSSGPRQPGGALQAGELGLDFYRRVERYRRVDFYRRMDFYRRVELYM